MVMIQLVVKSLIGHFTMRQISSLFFVVVGIICITKCQVQALDIEVTERDAVISNIDLPLGETLNITYSVDTISIKFVSCNLHRIPTGIFSTNNLMILDLQNANITEISFTDFMGALNLMQLDLTGNNLTNIPAYTFSGAPLLQRLYLGTNMLTTVHVNAFSGLFNLEVLNLCQNKLNQLPTLVFNGLSNLDILDVSVNALTSLNFANFAMTSLRVLLLEDNSIPGSKLPSLECSTLEALYISGNPIIAIGKASFLGINPLLKWLHLDRASVSTIEANTFDCLHGLEGLYMYDNSITSLPKTVFCKLESLTVLDLARNRMTSASLSFGLFSHLTKLELLYMEGNQFTTFDFRMLITLQSLEVFHFYDNALTSLKLSSIKTLLPSITGMSIGGNSMSCDALADVIIEMRETTIDLIEIFKPSDSCSVMLEGMPCLDGPMTLLHTQQEPSIEIINLESIRIRGEKVKQLSTYNYNYR